MILHFKHYLLISRISSLYANLEKNFSCKIFVENLYITMLVYLVPSVLHYTDVSYPRQEMVYHLPFS